MARRRSPVKLNWNPCGNFHKASPKNKSREITKFTLSLEPER
jgi:hypothetical protein